MGSFEKLGILVIVVIIVMILAVAIHQWGDSVEGGAYAPPLSVVDPAEQAEIVRRVVDIDDERGGGTDSPGPVAEGATWPDGTPRSYTIREGDSLWVLVVRRWGLREAFIEEIKRANPDLDPGNLRVGKKIAVPDPSVTGARPSAGGARTGSAGGDGPLRTLKYQIQEGDTLESIARRYLGHFTLWAKIVDANPGLDPKRLRVGQEIVVPVR